MKDFFDVYQLLNQKRFDPKILQKAVFQTFINRGTALRLNHPIFSSAFSEDLDRNKLWESFLQRAKLSDSLTFREVLDTIRQYLQPVYEALL